MRASSSRNEQTDALKIDIVFAVKFVLPGAGYFIQ
jgi:hypothetical protein